MMRFPTGVLQVPRCEQDLNVPLNKGADPVLVWPPC